MRKYFPFFLFLFPFFLKGQSLSDSLFLQPGRVISGIPSAADIAVDGERNIYLLEEQGNRLHKLLAIANYDSVVTIGGKSHREEGMLHPIKIVVPNRQQLYVLDEGNARLLLFNTNLKLVKQIDFNQRDDNWQWLSEGEEVFPQTFTVGPTGDLFILNRFNNKVLKINTFGEWELSFGGTDYGEGALFAPIDVAVNRDKLVMVSDTAAQAIFVYNLFGIFQYQLHPEMPFRWREFQLIGPFLICHNAHHLYIEHLASGKSTHFPLAHASAGHLLDVELGQEFIYLLFENAIHLYRK